MSTARLGEPASFADAASIARAFDETFAEAPRSFAEDTDDLLGAGVDGGRYLLRLRDVKGLVSRPKMVSLPSPMAGLVGVIGLRGAVVPVYGLGALLGHGSPVEDAAWVFLIGEGSTMVGLGAKEFTGYVRLARQAIAAAPGSERGALVSETARVGQDLRGVVDVGAVVAALRERVRSSGRGSANKET